MKRLFRANIWSGLSPKGSITTNSQLAIEIASLSALCELILFSKLEAQYHLLPIGQCSQLHVIVAYPLTCIYGEEEKKKNCPYLHLT